MKREMDILVAQMHADGVSYDEAVGDFKRHFLLHVLANHRGNQCKAAEELGMHRNTLSRTLAELNVNRAEIRSGMKRPSRSDRASATPARLQPIARTR